MQRFLLPRDLAASLGVSEAAVRRWGSEGKVQILRTVGRGRRIALREALRFIRESAMTVKDPLPLGFDPLPELKSSAEGDAALEEAILAGRGEEAWGLTLAMYLAGRKVDAILEGPITRGMHRVGEAWKEGPAGIQREHRATVVAAETTHSLRSLLPAPMLGAGRALGGAMEADPYMLPSMMVSATFAAMRWQEVNLGPNLPMDALLAAVDEHSPAVVWLSCSVAGLPEQRMAELERAAGVLAGRGIAFVVGGRGWAEGMAVPSVRQVGTLQRLVTVVHELSLQG